MKKLLSLILVTLIAFSLSGCTSITEVDENKVKDFSDIITEAIIGAVDKEKAIRHETHTINAENLNALNIKSSIGDIIIYTHDSSDAIIGINIAAKTGLKEESQQLVEDFSYSVEETSESIVVDTSNAALKFDDNNITTDLSITIPKNIENIVIDLNVGDITINNINGNYEVKNNVGDININYSQASYYIVSNVGEITVTEATAVGNSEFLTNTGDIMVNFNDITNADSIKAATDVGDINVTIPDDSSYKTIINEFSEKESIKSNKDENTKIELKTSVGNIEFN